MTDQTNLELRYRRLLAWYPREFRRDNGQEILAVLTACAREGQHRPGMAESADLIRSGLGMRLRPRVPRSARTVRAAVRLMYAAAVVTTLSLIISIISLAYIGRGAATLRLAGRSQPFWIAITVGIVGALVVIALWLWMARANSQGRNWARILSTVLFGLATLELISVFSEAQAAAFHVTSLATQPTLATGSSMAVLGLIFWAPTWLVGLAAVWLLWRRDSSAFFKPQVFTQVGHSA
jgi:hypothetical protein